MKTYPRSIAIRYLVSRRSFGLVTVLSIISVAGVTIGVAALVVVLSVFNGFQNLVTGILVGFDPHVRIERQVRSDTSDYDGVRQSLLRNPEVRGIAAFSAGKALVVSRGLNRVITVRGIEPEHLRAVSGLTEKIVLGSADFEGTNRNGIILGMVLADRLGVVTGDTISLVSPAGAEAATLTLGVPIIRRFQVIGLYETNNKDYDSFYAFTTLANAQTLFNAAGRIDGLDIRLDASNEAVGFARTRASDPAFEGFRILTWYDLHRELYTVMQIERWAAYIILCLIIAVASFNLLGSLTMTVIEKTRDIGILKAMGATTGDIQQIFLWQGLTVGSVGTVLGNILGLGLVYAQNRFHLFPLDPTVYIIPAIPVRVDVVDIVVVSAAAMVLCALAARMPARRAGSLIPAEAIRWE